MAEATEARRQMQVDAKVTIGRNAAKELDQALVLIGVKLPELEGGEPVEGHAMVNLGVAPAGDAFTLAHWIRRKLMRP